MLTLSVYIHTTLADYDVNMSSQPSANMAQIHALEEKAANVKEKVNEGVDEVKKRTSNVIKAAQGKIDEEDKGMGGKTLFVLALGCAAGSAFLAAKVEKCND